MRAKRPSARLTRGVISNQRGFEESQVSSSPAISEQAFSGRGNELVALALTLDHQPAQENLRSTVTATGDLELDLLTTAEAAAICRVSSRTIRNWIKAGRLRAVRLGNVYRIARYDLEDFILSRWIGGAEK